MGVMSFCLQPTSKLMPHGLFTSAVTEVVLGGNLMRGGDPGRFPERGVYALAELGGGGRKGEGKKLMKGKEQTEEGLNRS